MKLGHALADKRLDWLFETPLGCLILIVVVPIWLPIYIVVLCVGLLLELCFPARASKDDFLNSQVYGGSDGDVD